MVIVFGSINIDLVARVPSIPRPGETVLSPGYRLLFGGKGANQAVAAARARRRPATAVAMVAQVGDDEFGRAALANLAANAVEIDGVATGPEPTGCAFITVDDAGENAITVASGANAALAAAACRQAFGPADVLVLQMEVPFAEALAVAHAARRAGSRVIWNFAPAPGAFPREDLAALIEATDILVVNEHEALAAAAILGTAGADAEAAAAALAQHGRGHVVVTAGARGATAFAAGGTRLHAAAPKIRPVDTTGAGDTFVGVLAAELAAGADLAGALRIACLAASQACLTMGAQPGMPDRATIEGLLRGGDYDPV